MGSEIDYEYEEDQDDCTHVKKDTHSDSDGEDTRDLKMHSKKSLENSKSPNTSKTVVAQNSRENVNEHAQHTDDEEDDSTDTRGETETKLVPVKETQEKMLLIESDKTVPGFVFRVYFIQNSRDSKQFLVAKLQVERENQGESNDTQTDKPVEYECVSLSQVSEWIVKQSKIGCPLKNTTSNKEARENDKPNKKRPRSTFTGPSKQQMQEGAIQSWNPAKGYGFVKVDETLENIFFHTSRVRTRGWEPVKGERVKYYRSFDDKKGRDTAVEVELIDLRSQSPSTSRNYRPTYSSSHRDSEKYQMQPQMPPNFASQCHDDRQYPPGDRDGQNYYQDRHFLNKRPRTDDSHCGDPFFPTCGNCEFICTIWMLHTSLVWLLTVCFNCRSRLYATRSIQPDVELLIAPTTWRPAVSPGRLAHIQCLAGIYYNK